MAKSYPVRHPHHVLADESERFIIDQLPTDWLISKPAADYGQDIRVEIAQDGAITGSELVLQMKSANEPSENVDFELITGLKVSTYNYLRSILQVVMFVKYVRADHEAYWVLLRDVPPPREDEEQKTLTIRVPRGNRVSETDWDSIAAFVREVTHGKLAAGRGLTFTIGEIQIRNSGDTIPNSL